MKKYDNKHMQLNKYDNKHMQLNKYDNRIIKEPIVKYDNRIIKEPIGFINQNSNCWMNSLLQSLLSLSSFITFIKKNQNTYTSKYIKKLYKGNNVMAAKASVSLFDEVRKYKPKSNFVTKSSSGDFQCVHEAFTELIDLLNINKLFNVSTTKYIICKRKGKTIVSKKKEVSSYIFIDDEKMFDNIGYNSTKIGNYLCSKCKFKHDVLSCVEIQKTSDIVCVVLNKFLKKTMMKVPLFITIMNKKYFLVANIKHLGGHYICEIYRKKFIYLADDIRISKKENYNIDHNSFVLFYHFVGNVK